MAAPTAAGFLVTGLRFLAGGFEGEKPPNVPEFLRERSPRNAAQPDGSADAGDGGAETVGNELPAPASGGWLPDPETVRQGSKPALKAAAAVVTLGSGASLGPEGPSVEIGASVAAAAVTIGATAVERKERTARGRSDGRSMDGARRLGLIAAGSAAGISAGFGAPIAGLFFAFESILQPAATGRGATARGDAGGSTGFGALTTESVILASVLAAVVSKEILGSQPAFIVPAFDIENVAELPLYLPLGLLSGATAVAYRVLCEAFSRGFDVLETGVGVPREWHAPLGGLVFGFIALLVPEVTYQGFDNVNSILGAEGSVFRSPYPPLLLLELVVVKLSATSLCRQSGLVGGVYAPSLFMGAALGSAYGAALVPLALATGIPVAPPQAYALVGMAGVLSGICRVPLTAILLLFELTRDYRIIVPLMGTVGVASWVANQAERAAAVAAGPEAAVLVEGHAAAADVVPAIDCTTGEPGGECVAVWEDEEREAGVVERVLGALRVADAMRRDVPRVSSKATAAEAAAAVEAAASATREMSGATAAGSGALCCALVVDPKDGELVGIATAASLAAALRDEVDRRGWPSSEASGAERESEEGNEGEDSRVVSAAEACDPRVPWVTSSMTLLEASRAMRAAGPGGVGAAVVVARAAGASGEYTASGDFTGSGGEYAGGDGATTGGAVVALGVLEARAVEAEKELGKLQEALRSLRETEENDPRGGKDYRDTSTQAAVKPSADNSVTQR